MIYTLSLHDALPISLTGDAVITPEDALLVLQWQRKVGDEFIDLSGETGTSFMVSPLTLDWDGAVVRVKATSIGASAVSQEAVISVIPETVPPQALRAQGNAIRQRVSVSFSEPSSEERRVGKECRSRWSPYHEKKKRRRAQRRELCL